MQNLAQKGVVMMTHTTVERITADGELLVSQQEENKSLGLFDTIVTATGMRSHDPIGAADGMLTGKSYLIGDAYVMPTNGLDAIHHAAEIARMI